MSDESLCSSWLWAHDRWRDQDIPSRRLRLEAKRDLVGADLRARGLSRPPRNTRVWVRLPNWLGDVAMAVPLLRAVRESRPDAEITLLAGPGFVPLLESFGIDRKSTRLNSSHLVISYAVFCLKKKTKH